MAKVCVPFSQVNKGGSSAGFMAVSKKEWTDTRGRVVLCNKVFSET